MSVPRVSILLPVFDAAETLGPCLRSIARQSLRDFECWIVDDGSRDAGPDLARRMGARDRRFRVLSRPRAGLVATLNAGLERCRGTFVARMDADDWMHRERLARQVAALEADPGLAAVGCHVRLFPRAALGPGMRSYEAWLCGIDSSERVRAESFVECPVAHPTLMARGAILREARYRDRGWPEDYDLVLRLLEAGQRVGVVSRRLLGWRHGPERLSQRDPAYGDERFTACKAWFLARGFLAGSERYVLWGYGGTGRALQRALRARGKRPEAIVELHPGRIGNAIAGAPVVGIDALATLPRLPLVVSVAGEAARRRIRGELARLGRRELRDYVCAA